MAAIIQRPTPPNEWLYKDNKEGNRYFTKSVLRPDTSDPWSECTNEEKEQWEEEHRPIPPEPDEIQEAEIIES